MRYSRQRSFSAPAGGGFHALPFLTLEFLGSVNWTIGEPSPAPIGSGRRGSRQARFASSVEQVAHFAGEVLLRIGLVHELDIGVGTSLMHDGVARIAGCVEDRQARIFLARLGGEHPAVVG